MVTKMSESLRRYATDPPLPANAPWLAHLVAKVGISWALVIGLVLYLVEENRAFPAALASAAERITASIDQIERRAEERHRLWLEQVRAEIRSEFSNLKK